MVKGLKEEDQESSVGASSSVTEIACTKYHIGSGKVRIKNVHWVGLRSN